MVTESEFIVLWKVSRRGMGERHLSEGYDPNDFPRSEDEDGRAYFAKDRWIAELFVGRRGYEDWLIETRVEKSLYERVFKSFEQELTLGCGSGIELAVPRERLRELNAGSVRVRFTLSER